MPRDRPLHYAHDNHPLPRPKSRPHGLIQRPRKRNAAKPQITPLPPQERKRTLPQRLLAQHVLGLAEHAALNGTLAAAVELPQLAVVGLDEADVVQVDVGLGVGRVGGALGGGLAVGVCECGVCLEEGGAFGGREGDGGFYEAVESGGFLCGVSC